MRWPASDWKPQEDVLNHCVPKEHFHTLIRLSIHFMVHWAVQGEHCS